MGRWWSEDTLAGFQPPQAEFSLHTISHIVSQVPALICSETVHLSPNSLFPLKQHSLESHSPLVISIMQLFFF